MASNYRRILLKMSGEALMGQGEYGIDPTTIQGFAAEVKAVVDEGVQVGMVVGGGNIFRGAGLAEGGINRVTGDHMGMLATVLNALAMQDALEKLGVSTRVMSALKIHPVCEDYVQRRAIRHLDKGRVVIFAAGTGNPFFTTDSAASLRGVEIAADVLIKATKVNGIYSSDPMQNPDAVHYPRISFDAVLEKQLKVMDATAIVLCRENNLPLRIMNIFDQGALLQLIQGQEIGSLVTQEE